MYDSVDDSQINDPRLDVINSSTYAKIDIQKRDQAPQQRSSHFTVFKPKKSKNKIYDQLFHSDAVDN